MKNYKFIFNILCVFYFLWNGNYTFAQKVSEINFYDNIAPIIHKNCTPCHQPNKSAPFSLIKYEDVAKRAKFIGRVTQSRYMPPFPADRKFQSYLNERGLTVGEIATIKLWIEGGLLERAKSTVGSLQLAVNNQQSIIDSSLLFSVFSSQEENPNLVLKMNQPYQILGENVEDFRFFSLPSNTLKDEYIEAIGFTAGNKKVVHHSRLMVDTTNNVRGIDGLSETDPKVYDFQKTALKDEFLYGWVPGNDKISFPKGTGIKLNANSDFLLNIHYSPSPVPEIDQSAVSLFFSKQKVEREVKNFTLRENDISNKPFLIKAGEKPTFYISKKIEKSISLISVLPHMHLIGKNFRAFAITPEGEVVNLVKIDNWDFNWQMTYQFKKLLKIPAGSTFIVETSYDNSTENPENPNSPPKDIGYGWGTKDEMLNLVLYYLDYKEGDENIEQNR
jgi:Copper type II ascorbate-dependent monooxygenase, C-terminal domain